jgi:predicted deacylase
VLLASATPYTYTFLLNTLNQKNLLEKTNSLTKSLSGLDVPVLTFGTGTRTVVIVGRVHPGETNSSWVIHGLLNYL